MDGKLVETEVVKQWLTKIYGIVISVEEPTPPFVIDPTTEKRVFEY